MHDRNGTPLQVGDIVLLPARITNLNDSIPNYCNVTLESAYGRRPDDAKETLCLNTGVVTLYMRPAPEPVVAEDEPAADADSSEGAAAAPDAE
jgi:hypothetical protein